MNQLIQLGYHYRKQILLVWVLVLAVNLIYLLGFAQERAETELSGAQGTSAAQVLEILKHDFGQRLGSSAAIVLPAGVATETLQMALPQKFAEVQTVLPMAGQGSHQWQLLRLDFDPAYEVVKTQALTADLRTYLQAWAAEAQTEIYLTGNTAFQSDAKAESKRDSRRGEGLALLISLGVLVLNFGALSAALLPLLMGASTLIWLNALIAWMGWSVNPVSRILTSLVGLALSIDYALFLVSRFREERQHQALLPALVVSLQQAGHTVLFSGLIMLCSLSALLLPDVSLSRTVMQHLLLVIGIAMLHALVVLPAVLAISERWLNWPRPLARYVQKLDTYPHWRRFTTHVVDHYRAYFVLSLLLLGLLVWPVSQLKLWEPVQAVAPKQSESMRAYQLLAADGWGGELLPVVLVAEAPDTVFDAEFIAWLYALDRHLAALPTVERVQSLVSGQAELAEYQHLYQSLGSLGGWGLPPALEQIVNLHTGSQRTLIYVFPRDAMALEHSRQILTAARSYAQAHPDYPLHIGGVVARVQDFTHELYRHLPWMLLWILLGVLGLLWWQMKTPVLPLKAALINFFPILGAFGVLVMVFQLGWGQWLNFPFQGAVTNIVPIVLFCIVFGLSMDYEVLILSRVSEHYHQHGDLREALIEGLARSGSVITGAVLILLGVFLPGVFSSSPQTQEICLGIVAAIVLDATVVRLFLVPSVMMLMGRWNWWPQHQVQSEPIKSD